MAIIETPLVTVTIKKKLEITMLEGVTGVEFLRFVTIEGDQIIPAENPTHKDIWFEVILTHDGSNNKSHVLINRDMDMMFGVMWNKNDSQPRPTSKGPTGTTIISSEAVVLDWPFIKQELAKIMQSDFTGNDLAAAN